MMIFSNIYFDFFSVGSLILCFFGLAGALFALTISNKSKSSLHFGIAFLFLALFQFAYFIGYSLYSPLAAYHRWLTPIIILGLIHLTIFLINFPDNRHKRTAKIFLIVQYSIYILVSVLFFLKTYKGETVYRFDGHFWNSTEIEITKLLGLIILVFLLIYLLVMIWRMIEDKENRLAFFIFGILFALTGGIPAVTNTMSNDGLIGRNIHQLNVEVTYVIGFFLLYIMFINFTKDRTTFMAKIIGISLLSLQCVLMGVSYYVTQDQEAFYDETHRGKTDLAIVDTKHRDSDLEYLLEYSSAEDKVSLTYNKNNSELDFTAIQNEFINTHFYEILKNSSDADFSKSIIAVQEDKHQFFEGYKNIITKKSETFLPDETDKGLKTTLYIDSVKRIILSQYLKIKEMKDDKFRNSLQAFLKKSNIKLTSFNKAVIDYLDKSTLEGKDLKNNILQFHSPMLPAGVRNYRQHLNSKTHYTSFTMIDPVSKKIYEAGFSYLAYRQFMHPISKKLILMLIIVYVFILAGYPLFFYSTLIKPLTLLRNGHARVMQGDLDFAVTIKVQDEIGYITHSFNKMTSSLKEAKIQIDDYTNNLEEKVRTRTEELHAAMEEMEAVNEQLVEARDALWGEMELAKKIQTRLLPVDPAIADYEISAYMQPADEVGGDYYDIINAAGIDWIVIGDVSGHGVPAGLVMMMTQTAIHVVLAQNPDIAPDKLLDIVNSTISDNIKRLGEDKYMTITVLAATIGGKFIFSGLHQDIIIFRASSGKVDFIETRGMWIGVVDDIKGMLEIDSLSMAPGDVMLLYSDGITEAIGKETITDVRGELFGDKQLGELFKSNATLPVDEIKNKIINELKNYICGDDVTMVILKRNA